MIEKDHIFDKRIIDRNMQRGRLTKEEYEKFLKAMPDEAKKAEMVEVEVEEGEFKVDFPEPMDDEELEDEE